ncbi:MAG: CRISPR-associated endonuclease Cas3'' [Acidobacteriaceae bacterium]
MLCYAHTRKNSPDDAWHQLRCHLESTAERAAAFAHVFGANWARIAGLWHDVGKYQPAFQNYLKESSEASSEMLVGNKTPHSIAGAALAFSKHPELGLALAHVIAAHHGELHDRSHLTGRIEGDGQKRLADSRSQGEDADLFDLPLPAVLPDGLRDVKATALWIRMIFSALVDADMLDSEAWEHGKERGPAVLSLEELSARLDAHVSAMAAKAPPTNVNRMRAQVYAECVAAGGSPQGTFTLTVPTGGGKTLSGLAFGLRHAVAHGLARVIVVIPYTSILEQTVKTYREALGCDDCVIEHHSNLDPDVESEKNKLATENWDAPIVVTTSVQFFESLHASHKRQCRKLHRISNSVVLLDEVQTFPIGLRAPITASLEKLVKHFGTTVVMGTATQPALGEAGGGVKTTEIIPDAAAHFLVTKDRFRVVLEKDLQEPMPLEELAESVRRHERVLAIVHNRKDAALLAEMLGEECLHLSARMCAEHRTEVLDRVKLRLRGETPCRLVATQLVEAGVDIDFPVVYRAMAGLDTLAQAGGRCNREMKLQQPGELHLFLAQSKPPALSLRRGLDIALEYQKRRRLKLDDHAIFPKYFKKFFDLSTLDANGILALERERDFPEVAARFRMIDTPGEPVVAPYGDGWNRVQQARAIGPTRDGLRRLQRYTVNLLPNEVARLRNLGAIEPLFPGSANAWAVDPKMAGVYSKRFGFGWQGGVNPEPMELIA